MHFFIVFICYNFLGWFFNLNILLIRIMCLNEIGLKYNTRFAQMHTPWPHRDSILQQDHCAFIAILFFDVRIEWSIAPYYGCFVFVLVMASRFCLVMVLVIRPHRPMMVLSRSSLFHNVLLVLVSVQLIIWSMYH